MDEKFISVQTEAGSRPFHRMDRPEGGVNGLGLAGVLLEGLQQSGNFPERFERFGDELID